MSRSGTTTCSSGTNHLLLGACRGGVRLRSKPHFKFQIGSFGGEAVLRYVSLLLSTGEEVPFMSPENGTRATGAPGLHCICTEEVRICGIAGWQDCVAEQIYPKALRRTGLLVLVTLRTHRLPLGEVPAGNRVPGEVPATAAPIGDMRHEAVGALPCGDVPSGIQLAAMLLLRCSCAACGFMQERSLKGQQLRRYRASSRFRVHCSLLRRQAAGTCVHDQVPGTRWQPISGEALRKSSCTWMSFRLGAPTGGLLPAAPQAGPAAADFTGIGAVFGDTKSASNTRRPPPLAPGSDGGCAGDACGRASAPGVDRLPVLALERVRAGSMTGDWPASRWVRMLSNA